MFETAALLGLAFGALGVFVFWRSLSLRRQARARLEADWPVAAGLQPADSPASMGGQVANPPPRPFPRRFDLVPLVAGAVLVVGLFTLTKLGIQLALAFGLMVGLLGWRLEVWRVARRRLLIESQLADAIDLMIGTLRAGAGVMAALEAAVRESPQPLQSQLDEMLGRVRLGDDPQAVVRALERRVPLETFRLFGAALSVHWEVGGSLAPTLALVGRTIRDRMELARRIRSLTTQGRVSTIAVTFTTYFVAVVVWRNDPDRMRSFLATSTGRGLVAAAVVLQVLGIVWSSALSRMKY